jgi:hypothetical protein
MDVLLPDYTLDVRQFGDEPRRSIGNAIYGNDSVLQGGVNRPDVSGRVDERASGGVGDERA